MAVFNYPHKSSLRDTEAKLLLLYRSKQAAAGVSLEMARLCPFFANIVQKSRLRILAIDYNFAQFLKVCDSRNHIFY